MNRSSDPGKEKFATKGNPLRNVLRFAAAWLVLIVLAVFWNLAFPSDGVFGTIGGILGAAALVATVAFLLWYLALEVKNDAWLFRVDRKAFWGMVATAVVVAVATIAFSRHRDVRQREAFWNEVADWHAEDADAPGAFALSFRYEWDGPRDSGTMRKACSGVAPALSGLDRLERVDLRFDEPSGCAFFTVTFAGSGGGMFHETVLALREALDGLPVPEGARLKMPLLLKGANSPAKRIPATNAPAASESHAEPAENAPAAPEPHAESAQP